MEYVPVMVKSYRAVQLDISDLTFDLKENIVPWLTFEIRSYPKMANVNNKAPGAAFDQASKWDMAFKLVNLFMKSMSAKEQILYAKFMAIAHKTISDLVTAGNLNELPAGIRQISDDLAIFDKEIELMPRLKLFVDQHVPFVPTNNAGARPQDSEEMTFYPEDVIGLLTLSVLSKMMTPLYGTLIEHLKSRSVDNKLKEQHCFGVLTATINQRCGGLVHKLKNYIRRTIKATAKETAMTVYYGQTIDKLADHITASVVVRNFVNVDLEFENGNLMRFIITSVRKTVQTQGNHLSKNPVYHREFKAETSDREESNQSRFELDCVVSPVMADTVPIIHTRIPIIEQRYRMKENYWPRGSMDVTEDSGIPVDVFEAYVGWYQRNSFFPTRLSQMLLCGLFSEDLGGGKSVLMLGSLDYIKLATLAQMMALSIDAPDVAHMISALPQLEAKLSRSLIDDRVSVNYTNGEYYHICKSRYMMASLHDGGRRWDDAMRKLVQDDLLVNQYVYNTAGRYWTDINQTPANGSIIPVNERLINEICKFIVTYIVTDVEV